jgi:hypothetical protein
MSKVLKLPPFSTPKNEKKKPLGFNQAMVQLNLRQLRRMAMAQAAILLLLLVLLRLPPCTRMATSCMKLRTGYNMFTLVVA